MGHLAEGEATLALALSDVRVRIVRRPLGRRRRRDRFDQRYVQHRAARMRINPAFSSCWSSSANSFSISFSSVNRSGSDSAQYIGSGLLKAQADKALERQPIVQRILKLALLQSVQRLQHQGAEQRQERFLQDSVNRSASHRWPSPPVSARLDQTSGSLFGTAAGQRAHTWIILEQDARVFADGGTSRQPQFVSLCLDLALVGASNLNLHKSGITGQCHDR